MAKLGARTDTTLELLLQFLRDPRGLALSEAPLPSQANLATLSQHPFAGKTHVLCRIGWIFQKAAQMTGIIRKVHC